MHTMKSSINTKQLSERIRRGDRKALAQGISLLESGDSQAFELLRHISSRTHRAMRIGITGLPGSGKSTLIDRMANQWLNEGRKVGVIMVDPTSPITGGALLGDRIRLKSIQSHPNIFIRSMATRGRLGGLALASHYAADLMDAAGYERILIETVGVGQLEVDVASAVHCVVVLLIPGAGDEIQIMKAGLMEIADFFIMNKMDLDKDRIYFSLLERTLRLSYQTSSANQEKKANLFPVSTLSREGVDRFLKALEEKIKLTPVKRTKTLLHEVMLLLEQKILSQALHPSRIEREMKKILKKNKSLSAFRIAEKLSQKLRIQLR